MTEKSKGKKLLTWTLALSMTLALPPVGVFAEEGAGGEGSQQTNSAPATGQPDSSSNESGASNNETKEPVGTPENGGQNAQTAPPSGTTGTPTPSGEGQNGKDETLTPLLTSVGGGETTKDEGSTPTEDKDENKDETTGEVKHAATINGTQYDTLEKAIDAAENGDTVVLAKDVTENIKINKSITLDLNGKTLTAGEGERAIEITPTVVFSEDFKKDLRQHNITAPYFPNIDFKSTTMFSKYEEKYAETFSTIPVINVKIKNGTITGGDLSERPADIPAQEEHNQKFIRCGGGIRISSCTAELENCNIENNKARYGGGIFCSNSTVIINGGTISGNTAIDGHGNLYAAGGGISSFRSDLTINGVQITGNTANKSDTSYGGGLGVRGGSLNMTDTTISGNTAIQSGGGICIGPVNSGSKSIFPVEFTITGGSISENECTNNGGGIFYPSVQTADQSRECFISGTEITENKSNHSGGGIYLGNNTMLTVGDSTRICGNSATNEGGGISALNVTSLNLGKVDIKNNQASVRGGGIYAQTVGAFQPIITCSEGACIEENTAPNGGGIATYAFASTKAPMTINIEAGASVKNNTATTNGGGVHINNGHISFNVAEGSALYNNTATTAGDDLHISGKDNTISLADAKTMSGDRELADGEKITGWFHDGAKWNTEKNDWDAISRWGVAVDGSKYYDEYTPSAEETTTMALKAAYKPAPPSGGGGGGGGGHRPKPKPTVEIPDDDALGLNNTDHFAYIVGYGNGEVQPQNSITRAEVAAIFFRLLEDGIRNENFTHQNDFSDVAADAWYCSSVSTLSRMGIIAGYPDGTFRPNAPITRAEFAAIATRFDNNGDKTPVNFTDIIGHWAEGEITVAANHGWVSGYGDNTFRPQNQITRAETMSLVNRVLKRLPETSADLLPDMITWTDNADTSSWYYLPVQEATNSHYYEFKENSKYEKWTELRETRDWSKLG